MLHKSNLLLIFSLCIFNGCGGANSNHQPHTSPKDGFTEVLTAPSAKANNDIARLSLKGANNITPNSGKWASEESAEKVSKQLKLLSKWLGSKKHTTSANVITPDFACLLPTNFRKVFSTDRISIEREKKGDHAAPRTGDLSDLSSLILANATANVRCELKVFQIEQGEILKTTVRCRVSGDAGDGRKQTSSIWNCEWTDDSIPRLKRVEVSDVERVSVRSQVPLFNDKTRAVFAECESYDQQLAFGLDHWLDRLELYYGIVATSYHGLSVADVNGDGLDDLYVCQPGGTRGGLPNRLYLQQADGTVFDASAQSGLDWLTETHCGIFVDFDNDGDQDLVASTMAGLFFAENDGEAHFKIRTYKLTPDSPAISLAAADYDNDGDIDVYASCYGRRASQEIMGRPIPYHDANNGSRNLMFRNDQNWTFRDVTKSIGLDENNRRFSLACSFEDFDNDGDQDLYVANDFGRNNLYENQSGHFRDVAPQRNVEDMSAGMSVSWGDYDNNGRMDLYVSNMWSSAGNRTSFQREFLDGSSDRTRLKQFRRHARGNSLFSNSNATTFADVSLETGVTMAGWAWSSRFVDLNNDGREDLVVANGYITQENTTDL